MYVVITLLASRHFLQLVLGREYRPTVHCSMYSSDSEARIVNY